MTSPPTRCHVVCRVGDGDAFTPMVHTGELEFRLLVQGSSAGANERLQDSVWAPLDRCHLSPVPLAIDLYRAAATVYAADARVSRDLTFDGWTRDLVLHLPVSDTVAWERVREPFTELLGYLTGDRWELKLRPGTAPRPPVDKREWKAGTDLKIDAVTLMSGGLDSFVGALDSLADRRRLLLVSHNARGSARFSSPAQNAVLRALESVAGEPIPHLKMTVNPPSRAHGRKAETTQRSRSIIFMGLGVLAASGCPVGTPLAIPENGFISLNVPLTGGRLGSLSTRTTHPHTIELMQAVLGGLGLNIPLVTPYRFVTKGQMLLQCGAPTAIRSFVHLTSSCARPYDRNADPVRRQNHCGYCVPCIIRRAAMYAAGLDDPSCYRYDVRTDRSVLLASPARRKDLWAFEMALARAKRRATITDVLCAGPLPATPEAEVERYVEVYRDGLDEVSRFLQGRPLFNLD